MHKKSDSVEILQIGAYMTYNQPIVRAGLAHNVIWVIYSLCCSGASGKRRLKATHKEKRNCKFGRLLIVPEMMLRVQSILMINCDAIK